MYAASDVVERRMRAARNERKRAEGQKKDMRVMTGSRNKVMVNGMGCLAPGCSSPYLPSSGLVARGQDQRRRQPSAGPGKC